ncbi:cytochrome c [Paenibacillus qinlingensis]|uniref:Cytochrome c551 n=1 Tax=Paenibacillus qinlingensis TaxID=1837343 RepID=A0ABU1NX97_9BACL|nr:cytochrome c [Paenibacillus qinlingensis]MDR6552114.1 cytochrome c551 [Paenibacillus qinlingensis]
MKMRVSWVGGFMLVAAIGLTACGGDQPSATPSASVSANVNVSKLYQNYCISCHGNQLQGGQGPNIQKVGERLDEAEIVKRIQKGGGGMPPFQVTMKEEELKALATWLAGLK